MNDSLQRQIHTFQHDPKKQIQQRRRQGAAAAAEKVWKTRRARP